MECAMETPSWSYSLGVHGGLHDEWSAWGARSTRSTDPQIHGGNGVHAVDSTEWMECMEALHWRAWSARWSARWSEWSPRWSTRWSTRWNECSTWSAWSTRRAPESRRVRPVQGIRPQTFCCEISESGLEILGLGCGSTGVGWTWIEGREQETMRQKFTDL